MSDIFDEVEKLLEVEKSQESESAATLEAASEPVMSEVSSTEEEAQFNDSELEDIMAEIESLESDFETTEENEIETPIITSTTPKETLVFDSTVANKTDLQKEIEKEMALIDQSINNGPVVASAETIEVKPIATIAEETVAPVLNFERKSEPTSYNSQSKSEMSFSASGKMNLNLTFNIGSEAAKLFIDEERGLVVTLNGVELCLNETNGCTVTMENGINFNIPLTNKDSSSKKKVA